MLINSLTTLHLQLLFLVHSLETIIVGVAVAASFLFFLIFVASIIVLVRIKSRIISCYKRYRSYGETNSSTILPVPSDVHVVNSSTDTRTEADNDHNDKYTIHPQTNQYIIHICPSPGSGTSHPPDTVSNTPSSDIIITNTSHQDIEKWDMSKNTTAAAVSFQRPLDNAVGKMTEYGTPPTLFHDQLTHCSTDNNRPFSFIDKSRNSNHSFV